MKQNKFIVPIILIIILTIVIFIGLTYAYFDLNIKAEESSTMTIGGAEVSASFVSTSTITVEDALPGDSPIGFKDFSITTKNTSNNSYKLYLKTVIDSNTFTDTENDGVLYYDIYSGENHDTVVQEKTMFPTISFGKFILKELTIPAKTNTTTQYRLNLYFPESDKVQNKNGRLILNASLSLDSDNVLDYVNTDINVTIYDPIANTNTTIIGKKGKNIILPTAKVYEDCEFSNYEIKDGIGKINENTINALTDVTVRINYKCNINFDFITYDYIAPTTDVAEPYYTFTAPISGTYKLEAWGAQGGGANGGYGGYSAGKINLKNDDVLYVYVGGQGASVNKTKNVGGYNGGGFSGNFSDAHSYGGGGATHFADTSGLLKNLSNKIDNIIMVAGGGGGTTSNLTTIGGAGGGYVGGRGTSSSNFNNSTYLPGGGTQTGAGFAYEGSVRQGIFGAGIQSYTSGWGGGGGAGLYGGSNGFGTTGAGGSSYIGNTLLINKMMYCYNCTESNDESTKTVSTTCHSETPTENCAKEGNGYAKITLIR